MPTLPTLDFTEDDEDMRMRTERGSHRKSVARFARSLSRKVKRPQRRPGMGAAAHEAGVGLPPVARESAILDKPIGADGDMVTTADVSPYSGWHEAYPMQQGYFGRSAGMDDPYGR